MRTAKSYEEAATLVLDAATKMLEEGRSIAAAQVYATLGAGYATLALAAVTEKHRC